MAAIYPPPLGSILSSITFVSIKYRGGEKEEEKRKRERKFGKTVIHFVPKKVILFIPKR
jgi:hypothetical protein